MLRRLTSKLAKLPRALACAPLRVPVRNFAAEATPAPPAPKGTSAPPAADAKAKGEEATSAYMPEVPPEKIRNIAIIAHVDHGKTTLVDALLKQTDLELNKTCAMDSGDLEREKGITIVAKVTSLSYKGHRINIVDTPGHQDFGGQVERSLSLVDGVLLVVCACEGIMKETRFVLEKAMEKGLKPIVFINKVDREAANITETENTVFDLFCSLTSDESQLDYTTFYGSGRSAFAVADRKDLANKPDSMSPILDAILDLVPPPKAQYDPTHDYVKDPKFLFQVAQIDRDQYFGKIARGRIEEGQISIGTPVKFFTNEGKAKGIGTITKITKAVGVQSYLMKTACAGDIISICGVEKATLGDVIVAGDLKVSYAGRKQTVDPPLLSVEIVANLSPFAGSNGATKVSFTEIAKRLEDEAEKDPALRVERKGQKIRLFGRGDLHLGVVLENMRREGFEFEVNAPRTETKKDEKGFDLEPIEEITIELPHEKLSMLIEKLVARRAELLDSVQVDDKYQKVVAKIPSRGALGLNSELISDTNNDVKYDTHLVGYERVDGVFKKPRKPALTCSTTGSVTFYAMKHIEQWGSFFIKPGQKVFEGQVIGFCIEKDKEMNLNPCKEKHLTNVRSTEKEEHVTLTSAKTFTLEEAIGFVDQDELIEVSPAGIRLRKMELNADARRRNQKNN